MASSSLNPSAIQSRQWIMDSLINLMEKKEWSDISISEIATNAGVVRRTFYRHFDSKEDVLQAYLDGLVNIFVEALLKEPDLDTVASLRILFTILKKNKKFYYGLMRSNMLFTFLELWNRILPVIHEQMSTLNKLKRFPETKNEQTLEYLLAFNVGGTLNIVIKWIDEGMTLSPEELTSIVEEFSSGTLMKNS